MAEVFGRNRQVEEPKEAEYRNFKKGNMPKPRPRPHPWNASGLDYSYCCGLAATGEELQAAPTPAPAPEPVNTTVQNMQAWKYAKTALAIVGAYVVIKFLYGKFVK